MKRIATYDLQIGAYIREKRRERGMTQLQLAEVLGLNQVTVSSYELGKISLDVTRAQHIAAALGVSLVELIECGLATPCANGSAA